MLSGPVLCLSKIEAQHKAIFLTSIVFNFVKNGLFKKTSGRKLTFPTGHAECLKHGCSINIHRLNFCLRRLLIAGEASVFHRGEPLEAVSLPTAGVVGLFTASSCDAFCAFKLSNCEVARRKSSANDSE